jgi:uncharacterized membrane protein YeiH
MVWLGFEVIGTIAFAISGALVGIQKKLDIFGIGILAVTTAVGGGIIRDTLSGSTPPLAFRDPTFIFISLLAGTATFIATKHAARFTSMLQMCDAIGLGAFTATGASLAPHEMNTWFIMTVFGMTTGIGGGIFRDVFVQEVPLVFRREIYAVASLAGATVLYWTQLFFPLSTAMYLCFGITVLIRLLCLRYDVHLPKARA